MFIFEFMVQLRELEKSIIFWDIFLYVSSVGSNYSPKPLITQKKRSNSELHGYMKVSKLTDFSVVGQ